MSFLQLYTLSSSSGLVRRDDHRPDSQSIPTLIMVAEYTDAQGLVVINLTWQIISLKLIGLHCLDFVSQLFWLLFSRLNKQIHF